MSVQRPSLSLLVSLLALVMASAGAGYAAGALPANSVGSAQLKPRSVTVGKLAPATIRKLSGKPGKTGKTGPAGRSALTSLRSGERVTGSWALTGGATGYAIEAVSLPVPASVAIDDNHAQLKGYDDDAVNAPCTGTAAAPTAPRGYVCIYIASSSTLVNTSSGLGALHDYNGVIQTQAQTASRSGFTIYAQGNTSGFFGNGTWAYTAP